MPSRMAADDLWGVPCAEGAGIQLQEESQVIKVRQIGAVVLAVAAIAVWAFMGPGHTDRSGDISQALASYELNNGHTTGAPQQQVVNGWVAKDLLTVIARQQNDSANDPRIPALMCLLVLGVAGAALTSSPPQHQGPVASAAPAPDDLTPEPLPAP